jgi:DeoR/GlpR family transcriptional regulator of sugar metabolism
MASSGSMLPDERRRLIAERLLKRGSVSVSALEAQFEISPMTVRRDLDELERQGIARRTHGGAVLPGLSRHEDSFVHRLEVAADAKERLAAAAVQLVKPGEAVFIDSSTTGYFAARKIVHENVECTILTNAVPVMQLVCEAEASQVELIGVGGSLRKLTRSSVGPLALAGIEAHFVVLFSVKRVSDDGYLTDPDALESEIKRAMIRRARRSVLMVDGSKFDRPALSVVARAGEVTWRLRRAQLPGHDQHRGCHNDHRRRRLSFDQRGLPPRYGVRARVPLAVRRPAVKRLLPAAAATPPAAGQLR